MALSTLGNPLSHCSVAPINSQDQEYIYCIRHMSSVALHGPYSVELSFWFNSGNWVRDVTQFWKLVEGLCFSVVGSDFNLLLLVCFCFC